MSQLPKAQVDQLQVFITLLKSRPAIIHDPALSFFRDYLVSMGAKLPSPPPQQEKQPSKSPEPEPVPRSEPEKMEEEPAEESEPESDVELDMTGVIGKLHRRKTCLFSHGVYLTNNIIPYIHIFRTRHRCSTGDGQLQ